MNQDALPGRELRRLDERLPRRESGEGQGGGVNVIQRTWLARDFGLLDDNEFGVGAVTQEVRPAEDFVPGLEPGRAGARLGDRSGDIPAKDKRERVLELLLEMPFADFPVHGIHPGGMYLDEDLARPAPRPRRLGAREHFRAAIVVDAHTVH